MRDAQLYLMILLGVVIVCAGCRERSAATRPQGAPARAAAAVQASAFHGPTLARPWTFELVASSEGAVLLWAAGDCRSGLSLQRFDADGAPVGAQVRVDACASSAGSSEDEVTELSAASGGGRLGVAWIVQSARAAAAWGTLGADNAAAFAPAWQLGAADPRARQARGSLWLAGADDGQQRVAWSGPAQPCASEAGSCAQVLSRQHHPPGQHASASGSANNREIPHPCTRLLIGSLWNQGVWYDAFCAVDAAEGLSLTEVYAIRPEIFYAEASPLLSGCAPLGVAPSAKGVLVFGECSGGLRVHGLSAHRNVVLERATRTVKCDAGRPTLSVRGEAGVAETYKLAGPRDRLELWLPADIAGAGARAAFTGRRLLLADVQEQHLVLRSYRCEGERLVSDPPAML